MGKSITEFLIEHQIFEPSGWNPDSKVASKIKTILAELTKDPSIADAWNFEEIIGNMGLMKVLYKDLLDFKKYLKSLEGDDDDLDFGPEMISNRMDLKQDLLMDPLACRQLHNSIVKTFGITSPVLEENLASPGKTDRELLEEWTVQLKENFEQLLKKLKKKKAIAEKAPRYLSKIESQLKKAGEDLTEDKIQKLKKRLDFVQGMLEVASSAEDNVDPLATVGEIIALVEWLVEGNK